MLLQQSFLCPFLHISPGCWPGERKLQKKNRNRYMVIITIRANPGCSSSDFSGVPRALHGIAVLCNSCERSGRKALAYGLEIKILRTSPRTTLDSVSLNTVDTKEQKK